MITVSLNREALKAQIKSKLLEAIAARLTSSPTHGNHDNYYSPSRWWSDREHTIRQNLSTSATASVVGESIEIKLTFTVNDISS